MLFWIMNLGFAAGPNSSSSSLNAIVVSGAISIKTTAGVVSNKISAGALAVTAVNGVLNERS